MRLDKMEFAVQPLINRSFEKQTFTGVANRSSTGITSGKNFGIHEDKIINTDEVKTVAEKLNHFTDPIRTNLQFKYHEELNEYYVRVIDPLTNEVIKEIPPKKMLDMFAAMVGSVGILVDEKI